METLWQDLRYAARSLRKSPGFTLVVILTLALGIGANTAIFSVLNRLLLNPMPFRDAERLVFPWQVNESAGMSISPLRPVAQLWSEQARSFEDAEIYSFEQVVLSGTLEPATVNEARVSYSFLSFLGLHPAYGRMFSADEARRGEPVALLSYGLWMSRFGGRVDVLGEPIVLDEVAHTVIGIMPARLQLFGRAGNEDVWTPLVPVAAGGPTEMRAVGMVARLRPGIEIEQAQHELDGILARAGGISPLPGTWKSRLRTPGDLFGGSLGDTIRIVAAAVALVLLIACANVAQLLLARGTARRREIAVRAALGARRARLFRQLLIEALALALAGGLVGVLLAWWGIEAVIRLRPESLSELARVEFDTPVLWFALGLSMVTGILFGIAPALRATRLELNDVLRQGSVNATGSSAGARLRHALLVGEVALSVVLLIGAGLLIQSLQQLQRTDLGFDPEPLVVVRADLPQARYPTAESRAAFLATLQERAGALPGVDAITVATDVPPRYGFTFGELEVDGQEAMNARSTTLASNEVAPEYFRVLGIPLREGRAFTAADERSGERVAIINESMARQLWPGRSAVGQRFRLSSKSDWSTVVGVVANVSATGATDPLERLQLYTPFQAIQEHPGSGVLIVRTRGDAAALAPALRALVHSVDPAVPIRDATPVASLFSGTLDRPRFSATLLCVFAALATVLTAVGLFGVMSYVVSQQTREIGIRIALGAASHDVLALVTRRGVGIALAGAAAGLAGAWATTRFMRGLLYGVSATDPLTFILVPVILIAVTLLASYIPARRAAHVDPMVALRAE